MTIQAFARLCGCNPQTLRYYDRVDLLKPSRVDKFSGYRHYDEAQALTFVKIKNLQLGGFAIEEIRPLLDADDETVCRAFDRKIREQQARLETMKEIQRSYRSEMTTMRETVERIRRDLAAFDPAEEFGIDRARYDAICARVDEALNTAMDSGCFRDFSFDEEKHAREPLPPVLKDPAYRTVYEKHGWAHVKDFFSEFSALADGGEYHLVFALTPDKANQTAFATTVLNLLLDANGGKKRSLGCDTTATPDGQNHFWLLKKRF
jgi:DNA-binding transcriptional MerR regulator